MKRMLVAADIATHPCIAGNTQCIMQYVEQLRALGVEVYYLLIGSQELSQENIEMTKKYWGNYFFYYPLPLWQQYLMKIYKRLIKQSYPDNVDFYVPFGLINYVNSLYQKYDFCGLIVNYIWQSRLADCCIPIKALYTHDIFAYRDERLEAGKYWHHHSVAQEAKAIRRFQYVLAIQDVERDYFKILSPHSDVRSLYSSFTFVSQNIKNNNIILFFSGNGPFNIIGIKHFIKDVFPLLLKKNPKIQLYIGGNICSVMSPEELHPNIRLKGCYNNPSDFYQLGDIVINPVYEGTGLKIKTFESIAHGKVTIVDPHSSIGIYKSLNAPLIVASSPEVYVEKIMKYLGNDNLILSNKLHCQEYIKSLNKYISSQYSEIFHL